MTYVHRDGVMEHANLPKVERGKARFAQSRKRPTVCRAGGHGKNGTFAKRVWTESGIEIGAAGGKDTLTLQVFTLDCPLWQWRDYCWDTRIEWRVVQNIGMDKHVVEAWGVPHSIYEAQFFHGVVRSERAMSARIGQHGSGGGEKKKVLSMRTERQIAGVKILADAGILEQDSQFRGIVQRKPDKSGNTPESLQKSLRELPELIANKPTPKENPPLVVRGNPAHDEANKDFRCEKLTVKGYRKSLRQVLGLKR